MTTTPPPFIIGLTGVIAVGKTTVSGLFAKQDVMVFDEDRFVHELMAPHGLAEAKIKELFPQAVRHEEIDRSLLADIVFQDPSKLDTLESIIHPLVALEEDRLIGEARQLHIDFLVFDIPLLFEIEANFKCHKTICVTASATNQRLRVFERPGMTEKKYQAILNRQFPSDKKSEMADHIISTDVSLEDTERQVLDLLALFRKDPRLA